LTQKLRIESVKASIYLLVQPDDLHWNSPRYLSSFACWVPGSGADPDHGAENGVSPPIEQEITIAELDIEPDYFSVLRIPVRSGRAFEAGEPVTHVIVSETFAKRYFPGGNAVGHRYRRDPKTAWREVVGVAGHVRSSYDPPARRVQGHSRPTCRANLRRRSRRPPVADSKPAGASAFSR
jgi:hypothetical protein